MNNTHKKSRGMSVGHLADLDRTEACVVLYLRLWCDGPDGQAMVRGDFASGLGIESGDKALGAFEELCRLCVRYGRRPLARHAVSCSCIGGDEACFANFVTTAAMGDRDDAMMIATLLVRPDVAPIVTGLAAQVGLALQRMALMEVPITANVPMQSGVMH